MNHVSIVYRRDLLTHRFYRRWVAGVLSVDELRDYACQYAKVVAALPRWLHSAAANLPPARARLERHARDEQSHVWLWLRFAEALGLSEDQVAAADPKSSTVQLLKRGTQLSAQPSGVAVAWAVEVQTPAVSTLKLEALSTHYGIDASTGGAYFKVHSKRDLIHTTELDLLIARFDPVTLYAAQRTADVITDGLWDLLSSVNRPVHDHG